MSTFGWKRPKKDLGETEEDFIMMEKEFLEGMKRGAPAATAVRVTPRTDGIIGKESSILNDNKMESAAEKNPEQEGSKIKNCFTGFILEKGNSALSEGDTNYSTSNQSSLPNVERKSRFKLERMKIRDGESDLNSKPVSSEVMKKIQMSYDLFDPFKTNCSLPQSQTSGASGSGSTLVKRSTESEDVGSRVHPLLAGYSEADILQARESLLRAMKPETKEILINRRRKTLEGKGTGEIEATQPTEEMDMTERVDDTIRKLPIAFDQVKNIPHMDIVESEKLEWTKPVPIHDADSSDQSQLGKTTSSSEHRAARFSLDGRLMTKDTEANPETWSRGLHHHGEEMERPGYTMEELFTLSRSVFPQQRALGLNVLAEIFQRSHNGEFDFALDPSIFQACSAIDFIHVLRTGADCQDSLSINASLNCMASLLFPETEELCLDISFNWPNANPYPWLVIKSKSNLTLPPSAKAAGAIEEEITESDLKDFEHVKNDLLDFIISRTSIITRFNFLLHNCMELLNEAGILGILKVLIRISRHSPKKLLECKELLAVIQKNFMNPNWLQTGNRPANMSGVPLSHALKIFRILASSSVDHAKFLYEEFSPFTAVMSYLAFDHWGEQTLVKNVEHLVLESFNLWEVFLSYRLGINEYMSFFPVFMGFFQALYIRDSFGSFDLTHAARLHSLLAKALTVLATSKRADSEYMGFKESVGFVASFTVKMLRMLALDELSVTFDHDLCLLAILKGLECLAIAEKYEKFLHVNAAIIKLLECPAYSRITNCLMSHSLLLREYNTDREKENSKYPSNMCSSNAVLFGGVQAPILDKGSPFAFMTSLLRYSKNIWNSDHDLQRKFLDPNCSAYLSALGSLNHGPPRTNTFLRFELYCAAELLNLSRIVDRPSPIYKILPQVQKGDEFLATELLRMFIDSTNVAEPNKLTNFFFKFLFIPFPEEEPYENMKKLDSTIVPSYWMLEPLNILYQSTISKSEQKSKIEGSLEKVVKSGVEATLQFLVFCLQHHRSLLLQKASDIPALYSRIVLIFLMGNQVFMEEQIRDQLKIVLSLLLSVKFFKTRKNKPIFSTYSNVEDAPATFLSLYDELLEEYAANSFGDEVFGAYLILPLRTAEAARLKSLFWNNEAVQFLRTRQETSLVPLEYFTSTSETNSEILQIYKNLLHSKRITAQRNDLLHAIIVSHLKTNV